MIVQRDVERHRDDHATEPEDRTGQQVPAAGLADSGDGDDADGQREQRRAEQHRQEWRVHRSFRVDAAHRGDRLGRFSAIQTLHDEGRERVEDAADGGAADRGDGGQDDDGTDVHDR
jgi:hypothetical protein